MHVRRLLKVLLVSLLLSGCVAPLLAGAQSQLMWALLKPLVGFDPNEVNLFEQPLIKDRMQPLLGEHYGTAVTLLKTADEIQQEGPLFYVLSNNKVTGPLADKAGFVWNSQTNQMAVLLQQQGKSAVFSEPLANAAAETTGAAATVPVWPQAMQALLTPASLQQQLQDQAAAAVQGQVQPAAEAAGSALLPASSAATATAN
ncbi:hypothetical protein [Pseudaeromonas pectinilytica]